MDGCCFSTYCRHFPSPLAFLLFIVLVQFTQISFTSSCPIVLSPPRALFLHPTYGIRDIECLFQCSDPRASTLRTTTPNCCKQRGIKRIRDLVGTRSRRCRCSGTPRMHKELINGETFARVNA